MAQENYYVREGGVVGEQKVGDRDRQTAPGPPSHDFTKAKRRQKPEEDRNSQPTP